MSKLGFMQDLIRGITKIIKANASEQGSKESSHFSTNANTNPLLERAFIFIEDGDFNSGDEYCERVLDIDPKCAMAYLGKLMVELRVKKRQNLAFVETNFADNINYKRFVRFGSDELVGEVAGYLEKAQAAQLRREEERRREALRIKAEKDRREASLNARFNQQSGASSQEQYIKKITQQYHQIPSKQQIEESVKQRPDIKKLKTLAIVLIFISWPIALILFYVRTDKIQKAVQEEDAKYDHIRSEYKKLTGY